MTNKTRKNFKNNKHNNAKKATQLKCRMKTCRAKKYQAIYENLIIFIGILFSVLVCIDIGDCHNFDMRLMPSPLLYCWDNMHQNVVIFLCGPIIFICARSLFQLLFRIKF